MTNPITVFVAKQIVTMNQSNPTSSHVAVRDGRVLGAGTLDEVACWGPYELDDTFREHVLVPGMIEVHAHSFEGLTGAVPYQGWFDRKAPDGRTLRGIRTFEDLIDDLRRLDAELDDPDEPLVTIGFDPVYFEGARVDKTHLDAASATRPIFLFHANAHLATVNSAMLAQSGIDRDAPTVGVARGPDGEPNGELQEMPAIALARSAVSKLFTMIGHEDTIWNWGKMAHRVGLTSVGDLGGQLLTSPQLIERWTRIVNDEAFPARVTVHNLAGAIGSGADFDGVARAFVDLRAQHQSDKLRFSGVKFVLDGSIQGWTAVMNWPGYITGTDHGQMLTVPEQFVDWAHPFHRAGIPIHIHCNGTATIDLAIDTIDQLLREYAWLDHRHTIQHSQLTTEAQLRRMKNLHPSKPPVRRYSSNMRPDTRKPLITKNRSTPSHP